MSVWKTINSAPKDGTKIIVHWDTGRIGFSSWHSVINTDNGKRTYERHAWYNDSAAFSLMPSTDPESQPTHWMEIPAKPL